jgi:RimJ/RimL family protein N-acetyltransferase
MSASSTFVVDRSLTLRGDRVTLAPLQTHHAKALVAAAADGSLWDSSVTVVPNASTVDSYIARVLAARDAGTALPFVTVVNDQVVGSTRLWKLEREHRKLEIGGTWVAASYQRSFVNTEAKLLMLRHAFEVLGCVRVQFTTDELNERSRAAILRLGAVLEGRIRNERIMPDGRKRTSLRFSIIDDEWPSVKQRLLRKLST